MLKILQSVLLNGGPETGKTWIAEAFATEADYLPITHLQQVCWSSGKVYQLRLTWWGFTYTAIKAYGRFVEQLNDMKY